MRRQSKDCYAIVFGVSLVAITCFLIIDVQTELNLRGDFLPIPKTKPMTVSDSNVNVPENIDVTSRHDEHLVENNIDDFDTFEALKQKIGHQ